MKVRLSPKRFIAAVSAILAFYSLARVAVLFFEALAVVNEGRSEDYELLQLCQQGHARGSAKMREACLRARSELASPVVFKAVTVAVSTAFKDFSDTVGNPFKFSVLLLFIISSVALPIVPWCRAMFGQQVVDPTAYNGNMHFISYAPPPDPRGRLRRAGSKFRRMLKLRSGPTISEDDHEDRFTDMEPAVDECDHKPLHNTWTAIDFLGSKYEGGHQKFE